ncbi:MAG TPA: hypothetical protein VMR52_11200 [Dehalococcoidia bacterium]|nr:hypothetical protein [Dehalococcoidia bacterium]
MAFDKPIGEYESVRTWRDGLKEQWGEEPDMATRLETLGGFCDFAGTDPDTMIAECTRVVESGKRIRIKARREYNEKIAEFQASARVTAREQVKAGNVVRSFFIHNGIFMQAGLSV